VDIDCIGESSIQPDEVRPDNKGTLCRLSSSSPQEDVRLTISTLDDANCGKDRLYGFLIDVSCSCVVTVTGDFTGNVQRLS
jgi:hypothetical protein